MQRLVLNYDGSSLLNLSGGLNNPFDSTSVVEMGTGKYLYLGLDLPITNLYIGLSASATGATLAVEYYSNRGWQSTRYLDDASNGLSTPGYIMFEGYRATPWQAVANTSSISELSSYELYDKYWCRLSLDLDATITADFIGHKFCSSSELLQQFPALRVANAYRVFGDSKTTWEDETILASDLMLEEIRSKYMVDSTDQILDPWTLKNACVFRTAALIYNGFGDSGVDNMLRALDMYEKKLTRANIHVDSEKDGISDREDKTPKQIFFER